MRRCMLSRHHQNHQSIILSCRQRPVPTSTTVPSSLIRRLETPSRCYLSTTPTPTMPTGSPVSGDDKKIEMSAKDFRYCVDLVQNRDRESYLSGLLMPYHARRSFFAIRAFNVELASIKNSASLRNRSNNNNPTDGEETSVALRVRMQWWREALDRIYSDSRQQYQKDEEDHNHYSNLDSNDHQFSSVSVSKTLDASYLKNPIVRVMDHAVHEKMLTRRFLERLLEARENDLNQHQPDTLEDMVEYSDSVASSLLYLTLETVDVREESVDVVAQHAGIGIGLVSALRGARIGLARNEYPFPKELFPPNYPYHKLTYTNNNIDYSAYNTDAENGDDGNDIDKQLFLNEDEEQILKDAVEKICELAKSHLTAAQELQSDVPKHARACFLPVVPALYHLSKLERSNFDILDRSLLVHNNLKILMLLGRTWMTGVF